MNSIDFRELAGYICPPIDQLLFNQLISEFTSMEKRFILRDWEPATLDGGQFAEAAARILYHIDSSNLSNRKSVNHCLKYVEDFNGQFDHSYPDRKSSLHIAKVLRSIYKFRSDRGAVHIDPEYTANHFDAKLVLENSRWILSELLRQFWTGDTKKVSKIIRQLAQFNVPAIGSFDGKLMLQRTDCTVEEEILILLHHAGEDGLSRKKLGKFVSGSPSSISTCIKKLSSKEYKNIVSIKDTNYRLTDIGIKRVLNDLSNKLII